MPHYPANNNTKWYLHNEKENVKEMKFHRLDLRYEEALMNAKPPLNATSSHEPLDKGRS